MMPTGEEKKAKRAPLRSSIACLRCRKSKIKCDNHGPGGPCDTCLKAGKKCEYPDAAPLPAKRQEPPTAGRSDHAGSERKRAKKVEEISRPEGNDAAAFAEEVLSANYLSPTVWSQVFDLYRLHFATELPFLHIASLKEKMGSKFRARASDTSPDTNLVLLGILTLTARFHPDLVKYVANARVPFAGRSRPAQLSNDASEASDYFAKALVTALGPLSVCVSVASVERVQAFLMLGLYEWTEAKATTGGLGAWMYVGLAIRMAQALRLGFGDKEVASSPRRSRTVGQASRVSASNSQTIVEREIRRRTMFSCLILDRMLACGKERVSTIRSEDLQIQLPCSEVCFDLSENVVTSFLKADDGEPRQAPAKGDSVLGCFIRLVDIWGEISKFCHAGGRLSEKKGVAPWHEASRFRQLRQELSDFYTELPEVFQLSTGNYHRHENHQGSSVYVSLHMLGSLCSMMLHREYIPFIPIRCQGPTGPLDEPTFPESEFRVPDGFWEESAEQVFRAARDIVELIGLCGEKLPMSSLVMFSVWTASFVGIYAHHFPQMDQKGHMLSSDYEEVRQTGAVIDIKLSGPTGLAYQTLSRMSSWLNLAGTYTKYFRDMDKLYCDVKGGFARFEKKNQFLAGHTGAGKLSLRLGGGGGGLEEWKVHGLKVVNNGSILPDAERADTDDQSDRGSSVGLDNPNLPNPVRTPKSIVSASFTAINSGSNKSAAQAEAQRTQMGMPPQMDGAMQTDGADWRGNGGGYPPSSSFNHQQQQYSPTQEGAAYVLATTDARMGIDRTDGHPATMNHETNERFYNFYNNWEHGPWYRAAPGGIESLANFDITTPQVLLDSMDAFMPQQVQAYE
ncbi:fungal-specific transcription factor domain-containing protein [Coniochaeta sp. 2T2.1]|nr:fungal-specific transcription factor domain-containing protein [Coniochaeta sp. 2T2.1]